MEFLKEVGQQLENRDAISDAVTTKNTRSRDLCSSNEQNQFLCALSPERFYFSDRAVSLLRVRSSFPLRFQHCLKASICGCSSVSRNLGLPRTTGERAENSLHSDKVSNPSCRSNNRSFGAVPLRHCIRFTLPQSADGGFGIPAQPVLKILWSLSTI